MKTKKSYIHRGQVLRNVVAGSELRITQITKKAGYSRSSYYNHIEDRDLSYDILTAYGKAMKYDFTRDFPEMNKYIAEEATEPYAVLTLEQALVQRDHWRDKYYELLEKYHLLIEEKLTAGR